MWWCRPVILMLRQCRQENQKFKVISNYIASLSQNPLPPSLPLESLSRTTLASQKTLASHPHN